MDKGIVRVCKDDQRNWPYPSQNTTLVIPLHFDTYLQTQHNSASDASIGANYVA